MGDETSLADGDVIDPRLQLWDGVSAGGITGAFAGNAGLGIFRDDFGFSHSRAGRIVHLPDDGAGNRLPPRQNVYEHAEQRQPEYGSRTPQHVRSHVSASSTATSPNCP